MIYLCYFYKMLLGLEQHTDMPGTGWRASCWGCGEFGQHGHPGESSDDVGYSEGTLSHPLLSSKVIHAACGSSHSLAVTDDGKLLAWGNGSCGQLGTGELSNVYEPVVVKLDPCPPQDVSVASVACGSRHSLVLLSNGHVYACGNNFFAQLGYDFRKETYKENQPQLTLLRYLVHCHVTQVACGDKHTVFLFQDGAVSCVGHNSHGQIGDDTRHESVVPKRVELDVPVVSIACGRNHNLALSESGDVYVWGFSKGCGHRRNDVLSPELKLRGKNIVRVAGGATHSLALSADGSIYSWGFGSDGQLGLGENKLSTSNPKRIRHESLRHKVSFIACGETYSAAITRDGRLYMWGKNSHVISKDYSPSGTFFHPVAIDQDERAGPVHSIYCGSWHALCLSGKPDAQPPVCDHSSDSESESDRDLTSGSSVAVSSSGSLGGAKVEKGNTSNPFPDITSPLVKSKPPVGHLNPGSSSPSRSPSKEAAVSPSDQPKLGLLGFAGRGQTKLTIGEFYAMTDSSPSQTGSRSSVSQPDENEIQDKTDAEKVSSIPNLEVEAPSPAHQKEFKICEIKYPDGQSMPIEIEDCLKNEQNAHTEATKVKYNSAPTSAKSKSSSGSSVVSESSLKKRMAENLSANNRTFVSKDTLNNNSGQPRQRQLFNKTPVGSSKHSTFRMGSSSNNVLSPRSPNLIPRARSTEQVGTFDRAQTMFISRTPAEQFLLPKREPTFMACHSLALVDIHDLRAGSVFDNDENRSYSHGEVNGVYGQTPQGQGRAGGSAISRQEMMPTPADCETELSQLFRQRTPLAPPNTAAYPTQMSASETPSAMIASQQRHLDMLGSMSALGHNEVQGMFATPSPNFGRQPSNPLLRRSKTIYGHTVRGTKKNYRKPGLPGATGKLIPGGPNSVRPLIKQSTSLDAIPRYQTTNGDPPDLGIFTSKQPPTGMLSHNKRTLGGGTNLEDVVARRAMFSSAASWRTRNHTTLGAAPDMNSPAKGVQLQLNGVGPKNSGQTLAENKHITGSSLARPEGQHKESRSELTSKLAKTGHKNRMVSFTDIQQAIGPRQNTLNVDGRAKSVKKYR